MPLHLIVRGNNRQAIFRSDGDRLFFHRCLREATHAHEVFVHAYVFMGNHVHLMLTGGRADSVGKAIQSLGRRYVSYFNFMYERTGTLWEGRYRSCPVDTDSYFWMCHQYIENNPVRAGIVSHACEFPWSSHRCLAEGHADDLVTPHPMFWALADSEDGCRARFRSLFERSLDTAEVRAIREATQKGWVLGGKQFCAYLEGLTGRRGAPRKPGRKKKGAVMPSSSTQIEIGV